MMIVSGSCAAVIGFAFDGPLWLFVVIAVVWGIAVVAMAQFSAAVTELAAQPFVGTALSVQLGLGFALTVVAIWIAPALAEHAGSWRWAFLVLVPGLRSAPPPCCCCDPAPPAPASPTAGASTLVREPASGRPGAASVTLRGFDRGTARELRARHLWPA